MWPSSEPSTPSSRLAEPATSMRLSRTLDCSATSASLARAEGGRLSSSNACYRRSPQVQPGRRPGTCQKAKHIAQQRATHTLQPPCTARSVHASVLCHSQSSKPCLPGACRYHLTLFYPADELTLPLSVTKAAVMAAQMLSAPLAAVLIALDGAGGLRGWQWLTLVEGAATVAVALALPLLLPPAPQHVRGLSEKELAWVQSEVSRCAPRPPVRRIPG